MGFKAKVIQPWDGRIVGELLITNSRVSFLGDVDIGSGVVVGTDLDIRGQNIRNKVFVFSEGRGSTVGSNVLYSLAKSGLAPKLIGTLRAEPITISGAIFGGIPMVSQIQEDFFREFSNGDMISARIERGQACLDGLKTETI